MDGVEDFRRRALVFGGAVALVLFVVVAIFAPGPPSPSLADGVYGSRCCGAVTFKSGTLMVGGQAVPYVLQRDNQGLAAVPAFYVGVADGGRLIVERSRPAMKLRFDRNDVPLRSVTVWDADTSRTYEFAKQ
jgi:hypothetical protein